MYIKLILLSLISLIIGCAKEAPIEKTNIKIRMPASTNSSPLKYYRGGRSGPRLPKFTDINDIDCYAIAISYGGEGLCTDNVTGNDIITGVSEIHGSIPDGGEIELSVLSGPQRTFSIIGFTTTLGYCPSFGTLTTAEQTAISDPTLVGSTTADIQGESMDIEITVSMTGSEGFSECSNPPFDWAQAQGGVWDQSNWDQANWSP